MFLLRKMPFVAKTEWTLKPQAKLRSAHNIENTLQVMSLGMKKFRYHDRWLQLTFAERLVVDGGPDLDPFQREIFTASVRLFLPPDALQNPFYPAGKYTTDRTTDLHFEACSAVSNRPLQLRSTGS